MKKLYFDHNVIIDLQNKRRQNLVDLISNIDRSEYQILFSPAHIEEIAALVMHHGENQETANHKLDFLAKITQSTALLPFKISGASQVEENGIYISAEDPKITYKRVMRVYGVNKIAEEHQKEKIANGERLEKEFGTSPKEANNKDIKKEIDIFKPRLHQIIINNYENPSVANLPTESLPPSVPKCHDINFEYLRKFFPLHEMAVEKIFEFLEARRYFPDKSTQFLSGLHDTTHAIYAAYCDVFVTNDTKLNKKAAAAFSWLGVNTLVLNPNEFIEYLRTI